ncbi:MAG: hypothetical protein ISR98_00540 [Parcubacteria group bacterium]|nr:hypothetical protein [Parcubacteria group bacterium]
MLKQIEKLREKPEAYRRRVAFIISASVAGVIFLVWLSVLGVRLSNDKDIASDQESGLFEDASQEFAGVFEAGRQRFNDTKKELESAFAQ